MNKARMLQLADLLESDAKNKKDGKKPEVARKK